MNDFSIQEWKPCRQGSLRGFATVALPSGMTLHGCGVFAGPTGPWAAPPTKPMIGRDGAAMRGVDGKTRHVPAVSFHDIAARDRWSAAVIAALLAAHPDALDGAA